MFKFNLSKEFVMTEKTWTYLLYLLITVPLTVFVARTLYRNGRLFLRDVFGGNEALAEAVNHLLVVGFYLLNLGYVSVFLRTDRTVDGAEQVLEVLSNRVGIVALVLGGVHLANVWVFNSFRRRALESELTMAPLASGERTAVEGWTAPR